MTNERVTIVCESCERLWALACCLSIYERQALESRPCPHCGAYTLSCHEPLKPALSASGPCDWQAYAG